MRKLVHTLAGAAALATASVASAASVITGPTPNTLTPPASALFGATLTGSATTTTPINDTFTFNINGGPGLTNAQVSTILLGGMQNVNFTSIMLDGTYAFTKTSNDPAPEVWALLTPVLLGNGSHSINVLGTLLGPTGSYSGTINVQVPAVPEAKTWMMMLLGFGAMGLATRRRRRPVLAQIA